MFCASCGNQNPAGSGFCSKCGARLQAGVAAPVQPVQQPAYQQPVQAPPVYSRPAYDRPHSYRSSYSTRGSVLSWLTLVAALTGVVGCFLPIASGVADSSIFKGVQEAFAANSTGAKWMVLYPSAFVLMAIFALLLGLNAVSRRAGWLGLISLFSGVATTLGAVTWLGLSQGNNSMGAVGLGLYLPVFAGGACLIVTLIQLFAEGD